MTFVVPPWDAPFDIEAELAAIPEDATISGMFIAPLQKLPSARPSYKSFKFYPLREHCRLLIEAAQLWHGQMPMRQALRKLGSYGPHALMQSTLGKATLRTTEGVQQALEVMARSYSLNMKPGSVHLREMGAEHAIFALEDISAFIDCHQIGTFEGVLRFAGVVGEVKIDKHDMTHADFLIAWRALT